MTSRFNTLTLALIPLAIAINIAFGTVASQVLTVYLDSIGTVLVGVLAGPIAGALTGILANLIWGLSNPIPPWFAPVAGIVGLIAGIASQRGWLRHWYGALGIGVLTGIIAATVSAPISARVFGGVTGAPTDAVVAFFLSLTGNLDLATFLQGLLISDIPDKIITYMVVWLIIKGLSRRLLARFPLGEKYIVRRTPLIGRVE
jgi:energy-coupling factor transport system substrate-specific component